MFIAVVAKDSQRYFYKHDKRRVLIFTKYTILTTNAKRQYRSSLVFCNRDKVSYCTGNLQSICMTKRASTCVPQTAIVTKWASTGVLQSAIVTK